ncbi:MAG: hypothetical protein JW837_19095, partial [Sedimentisphaerales bacterium]|nr:hypothetical protein [Sedimentisphaerales bacterium]
MFVISQNPYAVPKRGMWINKGYRTAVIVLGTILIISSSVCAERFMEKLDRGVVAVYLGSSQVYVGWRMFGTDPADVAFNLYRNGNKVNGTPITNSTNRIVSDAGTGDTFYVRTVVDGNEVETSETVTPWTGLYGSAGYKNIPLQRPAGGTTPDDVDYDYSPNDASVGDLDGDGQYEIVLKWEPSNSKDNASGGYSGNVILDAYELDGTHLWRIDLGINIRAGAHYTQFMVYDLNSDGRAEVACKTAPGTVDGEGNFVILAGDDPYADYRGGDGRILAGPEYLTIFDGLTGAELATTTYRPQRGDVSSWGDSYGNRVDRFLACVAYLDGERPSLVMCRGYYARTALAAWDWREDELSLRWLFDTGSSGGPWAAYKGQGCHSLSVGDVDGDGKDEIIYGSCTIDDDGTGLYTTGLGHGDALHVSDMDPDRPGLEVWQCHETSAAGATFRDAATGSIIWEHFNSGDVGRACAAHIDSSYFGYQLWSFATGGTYTVDNTQMSTGMPPVNFLIWWNGSLQREFLDKAGSTGGPILNNWWNGDDVRMLSIYNIGGSYQTESINGTKGNPCLSADILGDWREECIYRSSDNTKLRILTTTYTTSHRIYTLMHDPQYRSAIAWQNVGYNQPPHPSFYIGADMNTPPTPNIVYAGEIPQPPKNLAASLYNGAINLDWNDNTENDFNSYNVYRSTIAEGPYTKIATDVLTSDYNDSNFVDDIKLYYTVTAVDDSNNESGYSKTDMIYHISGDLSYDGFVDMYDMAELGAGWQSIYNINNLAKLSETWLSEIHLIAHLPLDGDANDLSWNQYEGQESGSVGWNSSGYIDGAVELYGADDSGYIRIPGFEGVKGTGSRTCCAWIKTSVNQSHILTWGTAGAGTAWKIQTSLLGKLQIDVGNADTTGSTTIINNAW